MDHLLKNISSPSTISYKLFKERLFRFSYEKSSANQSGHAIEAGREGL